MFKKIPKQVYLYIALALCMLVTIFLEFKFHRRFYFCRDDMWYITNIVTDEPLKNLGDIIESQVWHYFNWGGRVINHGVLQFTLLCGEKFADVCNLLVTFVLTFGICKLSGKCSFMQYCLAFFMLISLNTDINYSMFWQSGSANYLYPAAWIVFFLFFYINSVRKENYSSNIWLTLFMLPLGLISGWSNENVGPTCALIAFISIFYCHKFAKKKAPLWMWIGAITSTAGSALLLLAPGNYVRNTHSTVFTFWGKIYNRFFEMLSGGFNFLFASLLFLCLFLFLYLKAGQKIKAHQVILFLAALLSYGAMILSPTFPNRAAFGTMVFCIALILDLIGGIANSDSKYKKVLLPFTFCMWIASVIILQSALVFPL